MKLFFKYGLIFLVLAVISPVILAGNDIVLDQDLEYLNSNLRDVIRDLAEIGGYRVILDNQVIGEVSLTLRHGVTAKEAIGTVARGYGYSSRWLNAATLMVGTSAYINGNFAARSTRIHTLEYADPFFVADKLQTVIPGERIKINHETKELTVTADIAEHQNISELVNRLDRANNSINLEIRVEELNDTFWKELQLEMDWRVTELGAITLNGGQQKLLQDSAGRLLLGKSDLICFDNQEARILIGDYQPKGADSKNGLVNKELVQLESGTRLILIPSIANGNQFKLKIKTAVKNVTSNKQAVIRGIQSLVGLNNGETLILNGVMQRKEYYDLKRMTTGYEYPILENLFEKRIASDSEQSARIVVLITPRMQDGSDKTVNSNAAIDSRNSIVEKPQSETASSPGTVPDSEKNQALTEDGLEQAEEEKPEVVFDAIVVPEGTKAVPNVPVENIQKAGGRSDIKYLVKKGDTPTGIARKFGVELAVILNRNKLNSSDVIKVGSVLVITVPADRVYVVKSKETLWRIAKRYGLAIEVLMDLNGIDDQTKVKDGQILVLPISNRNVVNPQF